MGALRTYTNTRSLLSVSASSLAGTRRAPGVLASTSAPAASTYLYAAPGTSHTPVLTRAMLGSMRPMGVVLLWNGASVMVESPVDHHGTCQSTMKLFTAPPVLMAWVR